METLPIPDRRVLIVDDDPNNLTLISEILATVSRDIRTANSAQLGLEIMNTWKPALVVLDQDMPGMTGLEMLKKIREKYDDVDVMFVSAHTNPMMVSQALEQGADDYIRKPFSIVELSSRVKVRFRIRDLREQLKKANALRKAALQSFQPVVTKYQPKYSGCRNILHSCWPKQLDFGKKTSFLRRQLWTTTLLPDLWLT